MLVLPSIVGLTACATPWPFRKNTDAEAAAIAVAKPPTQPPPFNSPAGNGLTEQGGPTEQGGNRGVASSTGAPLSTPLPGSNGPGHNYPVGQASAGGPASKSAAGANPGGVPSQGGMPGATQYISQPFEASPDGAPNLDFGPIAGTPTSNTFRPAQTVAIIGNQYVLAGDIEGAVNLIIAITLPVDTPAEKITHPGPELAPQKEILFRQQLQGEVQVKIGYVDFLREVPPERLPDLQKRIGEAFLKELEPLRVKMKKANDDEIDELRRRDPILSRVATLMNQRGIENLPDLDVLLHRYGTSLERQQRAYGEQKLSQMAVMKHIRQNVEITHEEMLAFYHKNHDEYRVPAKARWEQLSVRFDKFAGEQEAFAALAAMGNEVYLGGAALSAVAKRSSQEPNAEQGGQHDWTNQGSLASKSLDEAIFSLPLNRLSEIIRDDRGLHIVRVLERTEERFTPFLEAQVAIKDKIRGEKRMADVQAYLERVRKTTNVWTIYDAEKPAEGAR